MSDKELDDFFRHRAGNPDIPFEPADWEKMQAKLDKPTAGAGMNGKSGYWYKVILAGNNPIAPGRGMDRHALRSRR